MQFNTADLVSPQGYQAFRGFYKPFFLLRGSMRLFSGRRGRRPLQNLCVCRLRGGGCSFVGDGLARPVFRAYHLFGGGRLFAGGASPSPTKVVRFLLCGGMHSFFG